MRYLAYSVLLLLLWLPATVSGQTQSVQQIVQQKDKWESWIRSEKKLQISGRYDGRFSNQFRLLKLPVSMLPGRTTVLPPGVQTGQRITVSGILKKSRNRLEMTVERLAVGSTDSERLRSRIRRIPKENPEEGFNLADEFASLAEFYEDEDLLEEITVLRSTTFQRQRVAIGKDPDRLLDLVVRGQKLKIPKDQTDAIRFEALVLKSDAEKFDEKQLLALIKELEGWDKPNPFLLRDAELRFLAAPATEYEAAAGALRLRMHRRFYCKFRLPQILRNLQPNGSNGLAIAKLLQNELPEAADQIAKAKNQYVEFRLTEIPRLTRRQLEDLVGLLLESDRGDEVRFAINSWLTAQEQRLNNGQLDGTLATADEYFYAFDRWKHVEHKTKAVEFYKQAYLACKETAPKEASEIAETLEQYGWRWLHNKWMTVEAANKLPRDDVEIAMLNNEVVPGMKVPQVLVALAGTPTRKVRVISAKGVHEIWIYDEGGSTIVVHLLRTRFQEPDEAVVTKVGNETL